MKIFNLEIRGFLAIKVIPAYNRKAGAKNLAASRVYLCVGLRNLGKDRMGQGMLIQKDPPSPVFF